MSVDVVYQGLAIARSANVRLSGDQLFVETDGPMPVATHVTIAYQAHRMEGRVARVHEGVGAGMTLLAADGGALPSWVHDIRPAAEEMVELEAEPELSEAPQAARAAVALPPPTPAQAVPPPTPAQAAPAQAVPPPTPAQAAPTQAAAPAQAVPAQAAPAQAAPAPTPPEAAAAAQAPIRVASPAEATMMAMPIPVLDEAVPTAAPVEVTPVAVAPSSATPAPSSATPAPSAGTPSPSTMTPPYEATLEMAIPSLDDELRPSEGEGGTRKKKKSSRRR